MSESAIRAQIYSILNNVTNAGKVYDYERWAADWEKFISLFKATISGSDQIRGWEIGRQSMAEKNAGVGGGSAGNEKTHTFVIHGYLGLNDAGATEKTFNSLIEAVGDAFRTNLTLNGSCWGHGFIQVRIVEARMFGSVICHYAELSLEVWEELT